MDWKICKNDKKERLKIEIYNSVEDLSNREWSSVVDNKNIYLSIPYLEALELSLKRDIDFRYIVFYDASNIPVGICYVQILKFVPQNNKYDHLLTKIGSKVKNKIIRSIDNKVMVCGNVFSSGENGFLFDVSISAKLVVEQLTLGLEKLRELEKSKEKVSIILIKEFWPHSFKNSDFFLDDSFEDLKIDVNMVLKISASWKKMSDYLESMTTKFRTKAKGAYKKSELLEVRRLSMKELKRFKPQIEKLYLSVIEKADFKIGELNGDSFVLLKEKLKENFCVTGYFLDDKMIGFRSAFVSEYFVDASYVGLDYDINRTYSVYQRMLYDFVEMAINSGAKELRFGRTAEEIKSSLGAQPIDMKLYVRYKNSVSNKLIKPILKSISPREFELRNPFKVNFS